MFNEEQVEEAIIEQLKGQGYKYIYGPDIDRDYTQVILKDEFYDQMHKINKDITPEILDEVYRKIRSFTSLELVQCNEEFYRMLYGGVEIPLKENRTYTAKLIDKDNIENNSFLVVNQFTITEYKEKRPDIIIFLNGIPVVVFELKNAMKENTTIENAYKQIKNYQQDIKSLFYYNAFNVITDGILAQVGTITADFTRYMTWKSKDGEMPEKNIEQLDVLLYGVFEKTRLIDLLTNFIMFQNKDGKDIKVLAGYHQYFAVKKAIKSTKDALIRKDHKAGVVWHTQGSGKSFAMVFYTGILLKDKELNNPTVVVLTDRNDLDNQLYGTFSACNREILPQTSKQAGSREELKQLLSVKAGGIVFTTIQKFEEGTDVLSQRENIVFIADEAHRSQYGLDPKFDSSTGEFKYGMAKYMRDAMPNATFIGFTGTPVELSDRNTREIFGDYIDVYDMTQAVEDGATVPIYYENRVAKLKLDDNVLREVDVAYTVMEEEEEADSKVIEKSKHELARMESIIGADERLISLAKDIINHYEEREDILDAKAMIVCMTRKIAINLYQKLVELRPEWDNKVKVVLTDNNNDPEEWHGIIGNKQYRDNLAIQFKDINSEMKIAIVVDMWLTGFDVPSLTTMYIDKPMQGHTLMQAIARVNRVCKDKEAGLIVDYIGIGNELKLALADYTKRDTDKVPDISKAYDVLMEKLEIMRDFFYGFDYSKFFRESNKDRLDALTAGINYILGLEEESQDDFIYEATALSQADTLARSLLDFRTKMEVEYFKGIKVGVCKVSGNVKGKLTTSEVNAKIYKMIEEAIKQDGIINIFEQSGEENPEISILSDEYMKKIREMEHKNIAAELLKKLLTDNIKVFKRTNVVKAELFSEKLQGLMKQYNNRMISNIEILEELLKLSVEIVEASNEGKEKGLSTDEYAFYNALVKDPQVLREMQDEVLVELAHELTDTVKKSRTVDWDKKESARAYMRKVVKRLLRKYNYPPEKADGAVTIVIKQAELMSANIDVGVSGGVYRY